MHAMFFTQSSRQNDLNYTFYNMITKTIILNLYIFGPYRVNVQTPFHIYV